MNIKNKCLGEGRENIPNFAFHIMTFLYKLSSPFFSVKKIAQTFDIKEGSTVIDYGCGPGRYTKIISEYLGQNGKLYSLDIQKLAMKYVNEKIKKYNLNNVETVLANGYSSNLEENCADFIYAMDMFHMIENPNDFLKELHRLLKNDGILAIADGHQKEKLQSKK